MQLSSQIFIYQIFSICEKRDAGPFIVNPSAHLSTITPSRHSLPNRIWLGLDGLASSPSPHSPPFSLGRSFAPFSPTHPWRRMDLSLAKIFRDRRAAVLQIQID